MTKQTFSSTAEYLAHLPDDRREALGQIRDTILKHLPAGFEEVISYGMIGYVVPHSAYPGGYHCSPELPLPFMNLASQKNFVALYHMGLYSDPELLAWFSSEYPKRTGRKPDMGKGCIRFKKLNEIPLELIGELAGKMTPEDWIALYEDKLQKR